MKEESFSRSTTSLGADMTEEEEREASKLTCFEDIMEVVGSCGRWNVFLFVLCSSSYMGNSFVVMSYQFLGTTPEHWCRVESLKENNWTDQQILDLAIPIDNKTGQYNTCHMYDYNYTKAVLLGYDVAMMHPDDLTDRDIPHVVPCSVRDFNLTQYESSITTEWDLVCERRILYATTQAINQFGYLIGSFVTPILTDKFGRRSLVLYTTPLVVLQGFGSCFSPSVDIFIALRFGLSVGCKALSLTCFLIVMEWCSTSTRSFFGSMFVMAWALGCILLPGISYFIRPWRYLQAALVMPFAMYQLLYYRLLPESPRWLLLEGRYVDVEKILARIAVTNCRKIPSRTVLRAALTRISRQMRGEQNHLEDEQRGERQNLGSKVFAVVRHVVSPFSTVQLARKMCPLLVLWFTTSFAYYGLSLNATNISADPYLYIFLGGLCEVPSYLMLWLLVARAGRRLSLSGLYFTCALCIAVNASLMFTFIGDVPLAAKISLSLLGKMAIAAAFHLLYLYTAELFATKQRSLAVCHCCFFGRFGSIISPYVNDILGDRAAWIPSLAFSVLPFLSSLLSLLLPETRNQNLPEDDHDLYSRQEKEEIREMRLFSDA